MIRKIWETLSRPSNDPRPDPAWYEWATNQCSHVVIGACLATLSAMGPMATAAIVGSLYLSIKEIPDTFMRGGRPFDGLIDTLFVGMGAAYAGPWYWPWTIMCAVIVGIVIQMKRLD